MVLPSNDHDDLRQWLGIRGVGVTEMAGHFITDDLDPLLAVAGSPERLSAGQRQTVASARAAVGDDPAPSWPLHDSSLMDQQEDACEVLEGVCDALRACGVSAVPFEGLGVILGNELLEARLLISDLAPLYQRMDASREASEMQQSHSVRTYTLVGKDGRPYQSTAPGTLGGHRRTKNYGRLDCPTALRWIAKGKYVQHRVFFADEGVAVAAGYRPCGHCLRPKYREWLAAQRG